MISLADDDLVWTAILAALALLLWRRQRQRRVDEAERARLYHENITRINSVQETHDCPRSPRHNYP